MVAVDREVVGEVNGAAGEVTFDAARSDELGGLGELRPAFRRKPSTWSVPK
jgi:hypothetical protein